MWKYFKTTIEAVSELKALGYKIVGIEQAEGSVDLGSFRVKKVSATLLSLVMK